jgi:anti-sigma regulatory factor (Ser/Thr protein kinase)
MIGCRRDNSVADRDNHYRRRRDVGAVRQRARRVAELLGFEPRNRTRIATAVSAL